MKIKKKKKPNTKIRYNIVTTIVYIAGIILLAQLFNLQIVHGKEFRETSNVKLTRETVTKAARGTIKDSSGNIIAGVELGFSLELYKTKQEPQELNQSILNLINVLEKNGDTYIDTFPIKMNPIEFTYQDEEDQIAWKQKNGIDKNATAEESFFYFMDKYGINLENLDDARKIMLERYRISKEGYSATKSIVISKNISKQSVLELEEQREKFPGINIVKESIRTYPYRNLASHIVGYINSIGNDLETAKEEYSGYTMNDIYGKAGIERMFEKYLRGKDGLKQIDMTVEGTITDEYIAEESEAGADVVLTIDLNLQSEVEKILENTVNSVKNGSTGGSIVVMNVSTGSVLAMASNPNYDPTEFIGGISQSKWEEFTSEENNKPLLDRSIQSIYAPGSTFKMVTSIAGLETEKITPTSTINDTGVYPRGHKPACWIYSQTRGGHGYLNVKQAIQRSCNYFFYEVGYRVGIDVIYKYAQYFGLDDKTGIELSYEASGKAAQQSSAEEKGGWYVGDTLNASIGQGYNSFTPIEMAQYVATIANGGKRIRPTIVKSVVKSDGVEISREEIRNYVDQKAGIEKEDTDITISEETIQTVKEGMLAVTSQNGGTAYSTFKDFRVQVAGKTGTADIDNTGKVANGWFVGFAPYSQPEIAVAVVIEKGGSGQYATVAAKQVLESYFGMNTDKITEDRSDLSYVEMQN